MPARVPAGCRAAGLPSSPRVSPPPLRLAAARPISGPAPASARAARGFHSEARVFIQKHRSRPQRERACKVTPACGLVSGEARRAIALDKSPPGPGRTVHSKPCPRSLACTLRRLLLPLSHVARRTSHVARPPSQIQRVPSCRQTGGQVAFTRLSNSADAETQNAKRKTHT